MSTNTSHGLLRAASPSPSPSPSPGSKLRRVAHYRGHNPFEPRMGYPFSEKLKVFFFTLTLIAPIRFILIFVILIVGSILAIVATIGHPTNQPLPAWRWLLAQPLRAFARLVLFVAGFWYIDIHKKPNAQPRTARVLVANHVTIFDGFFILYLIESSVVCKAELLNIPILGHLLRGFQALGVERLTRSGRQKCIDQMKDRISNKAFPPLLIFPEGTTHSSNTMIMFKRGVFNAGVPVQPVTLDFCNKRADLSYIEEAPLWYLYYACCQFTNHVKVSFLDLYIPNEEEKMNSMIYAGRVRQVMANYMNIVPTDHSYSDIRLAMLAKRGQTAFSNNIVVNDVSSALKLKSAQLLGLAKIFLELDVSRTGTISYEEFCDRFKINAESEGSQRLFSVFDTDDNKVIGFAEFLTGICAAIQEESIEDAVVIMFQMCDWRGTGQITRKDIHAVSTNWELANLTMKLDPLNEAIFPYNPDESIDFDTFRARAMVHPARIRDFLQFMLQQRLNLDLDGIVSTD